MFEKLKFWKKKEPFDYSKLESEYGSADNSGKGYGFGGGHDPASGLGGTPDLGPLPGSEEAEAGEINIKGEGYERHDNLTPTHLENDNYGHAPGAARGSQGRTFSSADMTSKDIEIISAKLDGLKAAIETLNAKIGIVEEELRRNRRSGW